MLNLAQTAVKATTTLLLMAAVTIAILFGMVWLTSPVQNNIVINEVLLNPTEAGWNDAFIELYNPGDQKADIAGWQIRSGKSRARLFGEVPPKGFRVIYGGIAVEGDIGLFNSVGVEKDVYEVGQKGGFAAGRIPDGGDTFKWVTTPTPGAPNTIEQAEKGEKPPQCNVGKDLCDAISEANPVAKNKIAQMKDKKAIERIGYVLAQRKISREREEKVRSITVSSTEVHDALTGLVGPSMMSAGLNDEIAKMNGKFRAMLVDILTNGTKAERAEIKIQFENYVRMRGEPADAKVDPKAIRVLLARDAKMDELLAELGL